VGEGWDLYIQEHLSYKSWKHMRERLCCLYTSILYTLTMGCVPHAWVSHPLWACIQCVQNEMLAIQFLHNNCITMLMCPTFFFIIKKKNENVGHINIVNENAQVREWNPNFLVKCKNFSINRFNAMNIYTKS
jgi:hypothetical protein